MGVITESVGAAGEYEEVEIPGMADAAGGPAGTVLRRRSPRPSRRAVLHVHSSGGSGVPEDLARWYTERGFHFYVIDLTAPGTRRWRARLRRRTVLRARFGMLDAACRHLREADGIDSVVISAQSADALTVALWCDARHAAEPAGALILSRPVFGRRLRHGLRIACPVLVICPAGDGTGQAGQEVAAGEAAPGEAVAAEMAAAETAAAETAAAETAAAETAAETAGGLAAAPRAPGRRGRRRRAGRAPAALGPHVTWLWLPGGLDSPERAGAADRRLLFDEIGRWLGAYMYGQVRDQLL
jgi:hypothetical protein